MMKEKNMFFKGIVTDLDYQFMAPGQWVFPTMSARLINKKGQGLIITNMQGQEEEFSIKSGYVVLGACEYDNIMYIVSQQENGTLGEIGCFPSPKEATANNTTFERNYKALVNFKESLTSHPSSFNTPLFNFDPESFLNVFAQPAYDGSVNIYFTDYRNPIRVINNNFDKDGRLLDRWVYNDSFNGAINLIASSNEIPGIELDSVNVGGKLQPGVYYFYIKYLTRDFVETNFIEEFGPIAIFDGDGDSNVKGQQFKNWLTGELKYINKNVKLRISNIDRTYSYINVGVMFYSADTENSVAAPQTYRINLNYPINADTKEIIITGEESQSLLTIEEIMTPRLPYDMNRDHCVVNNTYYGFNWKREQIEVDYDVLREYAQRITLSEIKSPALAPSNGDFNNNVWGKPIFYKDIDNLNSYVGYMRLGIYPFAVKFIFQNGFKTDAFPVKGNIKGILNTKGLFQFGDFEANSYDLRYALGIRFNIQAANAYAETQDLFDKIVAIEFCRGDRIENFICQGVALPTFNKITYTSETTSFGADGAFNPDDSVYVPSWKGLFPTAHNGGTSPTGADKITYYGVSDSHWASSYSDNMDERSRADDTKRFGIFSPDLILSPDMTIPENIYLRHTFTLFSGDITESSPYNERVKPKCYGVKYSNLEIFYANDPDRSLNAKAYKVIGGMPGGDERFTGQFETYSSKVWNGDNTWVIDYNRGLNLSNYVGIVLENGMNVGSSVILPPNVSAYEVFSIYNRNPEDPDYLEEVVENFSPETTIYYAITKKYTKWWNITTVDAFKGDTFLQHSVFRTHRWVDYTGACITGQNLGGFGGRYRDWSDRNAYYQWGFFIHMITENLINADLRNFVNAYNDEEELLTYRFYPAVTGRNWLYLSDRDEDVIEAKQVNDGYNKVLPPEGVFGNDENIPYEANDDRKTRIYHSSTKPEGSIIDSLRDIAAGNFIDLPSAAGDGQRLLPFDEIDSLISVQERALNQHIIKQRVIENDSVSGNIILASEISLLPDFFINLSPYGTQHKTSIILTETGIYGVDWNKNALWKIYYEYNQAGNKFLKVDNLLDKLFVRKWWEDMKTPYTEYNDRLAKLEDNPIKAYGIVAGYNRAYKELYLSFLLTGTTTQTDAGEVTASNKTLIIKDDMNIVIGEAPFIQYRYANINDDLYSLDVENNRNVFMRHDAGAMQKFNGTQSSFMISFIVNGNSSEEQKLYDLEKTFESLEIEMTKEDITRILYETESQRSTYIFRKRGDSSGKFWLYSEYLQNEWQVPIFVSDIDKNKDYEQGSDIRGHWLKVTIIYNPTAEAQEIYLKKVITNFTESKA